MSSVYLDAMLSSDPVHIPARKTVVDNSNFKRSSLRGAQHLNYTPSLGQNLAYIKLLFAPANRVG